MSFPAPAASSLSLALLLSAALPASASAALPSNGSTTDSFAAGYAAAVAEREFGLPPDALRVEGGLVTVEAPGLGEEARRRLSAALAGVPGVRSVKVLPADAASAGPAPVPPPASSPAPVPVPVPAGAAPAAEILPPRSVFEPLTAARWPRFSASYRWYTDDDDVTHAGAVSFGETFPLVGGAALDGRWELGIQAAVFALFDLPSESMDLINADYWVGVPLAWRSGDFSAQARLFHQSSHLGDEYILREDLNEAGRENLSYEALDLLLSYDLEDWRVYGGGTWRFRRDPDSFGEWVAQTGVEYEGPGTIWGGRLRPVAAVDVQFPEEADYEPDISIRAGVKLENARFAGRSVLLLSEYYRGHNPNGQFYRRDLEYIGLGVQLQLD
jgi:Protein of unknown function (DUF1207)